MAMIKIHNVMFSLSVPLPGKNLQQVDIRDRIDADNGREDMGRFELWQDEAGVWALRTDAERGANNPRFYPFAIVRATAGGQPEGLVAAAAAKPVAAAKVGKHVVTA